MGPLGVITGFAVRFSSRPSSVLFVQVDPMQLVSPARGLTGTTDVLGPVFLLLMVGALI